MNTEPARTQADESSGAETPWQTQFDDMVQENSRNESPEENEEQEETVNAEPASDYRWVPVELF